MAQPVDSTSSSLLLVCAGRIQDVASRSSMCPLCCESWTLQCEDDGQDAQEHFLWRIGAPSSSYSCLVTHWEAKELRDERVEAPLQTAYLLKASAITLTSVLAGRASTSSLRSLSGSPSNSVVPPERITFLARSFLTSRSDS